MSKPLIYLYTSDKAKKKFSAFYPTSKKVIHFGGKGYRDYTLMNDKKSVHYLSSKKERDSVKDRYRVRHAKDNLDDPESPGSLSYEVLWSSPTLRGGIRNYSRKYGYKVVDKTDETYSPDKVKELISS